MRFSAVWSVPFPAMTETCEPARTRLSSGSLVIPPGKERLPRGDGHGNSEPTPHAHGGRPTLNFVSAPGGSAFMAELMDVLADSVRRAGGAASSYEGLVPIEDTEAVCLVVPHEYFAVVPASLQPSAGGRKRMIGVCVEHPGTATFETVAAHSRDLGGVVATSTAAVSELRRRGIVAQPFVLGYSPLWDRWGGDAVERPVDITYLGTLDSRRSEVIAGWAETLWPWRTRFVVPPHEPMTQPRPYFLMGEEKWKLLASAKIILNLHREGSHALEWVRALEAACNGCVVVTERALACAPFVPGKHFIVGRPENLARLATTLLRHPERLAAIREAAYEACRQRLDMAESAERLLAIAGALPPPTNRSSQRSRIPPSLPRSVPPLDDRVPLAIDPPPTEPAATDALRQTVCRLLQNDIQRRRSEGKLMTIERQPELQAAEVDVLLIGAGDGGEQSLRSLLRQSTAAVLGIRTAVMGIDQEMAGAGDASRSLSGQKFAGGWIELCHTAQLGRAFLLNEALKTVRAPLTLVAQPGMHFFPTAVERLADALAASGAEAALCLARRASGGIGNLLPPEARRLARYPYLGSGFLIATAALRTLGGFAEDPALEGLEDHDFWCRFAERGLSSAMVTEILITSVALGVDEVRPIDLDPSYCWQVLRRRSPGVHRYLPRELASSSY